MRKRLIKFILSILIASVLVLTLFFIGIINNQYNQNIIRNLKENNQFIISLLQTNNVADKDMLFKNNLNKFEFRVTYIDKSGKVIFDSIADSETMDNHNGRPEVIEAREKGTGSSLRLSKTINKNMLYVASTFGDGYIIRSSMPVDVINSFERKYIQYYIITLICVLIAASIISLRLSHILVNPINELHHVTSRVANGELFERVKTLDNTEIGDLGRAFNNMADKLQLTLKEVTNRQNRLESILRSMDSGVIAVDTNYKIIMINPYAKEIFGIKTDIIGKNLLDIIRDFELENVFKNTSEDYSEIKLLWPKERDLRVRTADIIGDNEIIGKVAVVQDITDIKRLENMRSEFVANVSHELKTPLTSIKGFAETLRYVEDKEKREKFLDIIDDEADRLTRLINDILILSHIEQHREGKHENINAAETIAEVYNLMKNTAENKNVKITVAGTTQCIIKGDKDRFMQMLINLVDNAIKYSESGASVFISTQVSKGNFVLTVEDTGVGMYKEHLDRIFERFYRVDKARSRAQGGTGLGLAIVKHIVLSFSGTINVESELSKGTKFIITIPITE